MKTRKTITGTRNFTVGSEGNFNEVKDVEVIKFGPGLVLTELIPLTQDRPMGGE